MAAVPAAVTDDRAGAFETMRGDLITYWSLPFYRAMIERSGFGADIAAFDAGMKAGDLDKAEEGISDALPRGAHRDRDAGGGAGRRRPLPRGRRHVTVRGPGPQNGLRRNARSAAATRDAEPA